MKVVFSLKYFLPKQVAGTEVYVAALAKSFLRKQVEVLVLKPGFESTQVSEYEYEGIRVIEYPESPSTDRALIAGERPPIGIHAFEKVLLGEMPDIIHFHEISGSNGITMYHIRIARKLNIKVFTTLHLPGYVCKSNNLLYKNTVICDGVIRINKCAICTLHKRGIKEPVASLLASTGNVLRNAGVTIPERLGGIGRLLKYPAYIVQHRNYLLEIFESSERVFVLSNWFREVLLKNGLSMDKMTVLPKALPQGSPNRKLIREVDFIKNKEVRLVYIGRICEVKGLGILLKALSYQKLKNWSLDIYGQITEDDYYQECLMISKEFKSQINWRGILAPDLVVTSLKEYDVLVFPSMIEEMVGLVVQEAFAAGIPVIGSAASGIREQVSDKVNGLLFDIGKIDQLADIIREILLDPSIIFKLSQNFPDQFTFDEVADITQSVYFPRNESA